MILPKIFMFVSAAICAGYSVVIIRKLGRIEAHLKVPGYSGRASKMTTVMMVLIVIFTMYAFNTDAHNTGDAVFKTCGMWLWLVLIVLNYLGRIEHSLGISTTMVRTVSKKTMLWI